MGCVPVAPPLGGGFNGGFSGARMGGGAMGGGSVEPVWAAEPWAAVSVEPVWAAELWVAALVEPAWAEEVWEAVLAADTWEAGVEATADRVDVNAVPVRLTYSYKPEGGPCDVFESRINGSQCGSENLRLVGTFDSPSWRNGPGALVPVRIHGREPAACSTTRRRELKPEKTGSMLRRRFALRIS